MEVEVGKIDEEAEDSHDEEGLQNVEEEDVEIDHELAEHNEEGRLPQRLYHLISGILVYSYPRTFFPLYVYKLLDFLNCYLR